MKILFTKSDKLLSKIIRDVLEEPISHVALQFGNFVVHSNLIGLHIEWAPNFIKHSEIVHTMAPIEDNLSELLKLDNLLSKYEFSFYDFGALLFMGVSFTLRKYLKVPLPKSNLWQSTGMFLCTEWVTKYLHDKENSMITPYQLYQNLLLNADFIEINT